jgi:cobalamin synthase
MPEPAEQPDEPESSPPGAARAWPVVGDLAAAIRQLTFLEHGERAFPMGASAMFYPLVGLGIGGLWILVDRLAAFAGSPLLSAALVLTGTVLATRARPLLGAGRTLAASFSRSRARALRLMDGPVETAALAAAAVVLALELLCLIQLDRLRFVGLAAAPLLGRWSMVVMAVGSRAARADGRRYKFDPQVTFRELGVTSTVTFALLFAATGFLGVVLVLSVAAAVVGLRTWLHHRLHGITCASLGAACELAQLITLALLAPF